MWRQEDASLVQDPAIHRLLASLDTTARTVWITRDRVSLLLHQGITDPAVLSRWLDWLDELASTIEAA